MSQFQRSELSVRQERAILVGVILPKSTSDPRAPLGELIALAKTAGARVVGQILQNRHKVDAGLYVGSGKAMEIAHLAAQENADVIIFDNDLSPAQIGGLEKLINEELKSPRGQGVKVLDRSELILDIFATRAQTREAKLQVELAQMEYTYPRLTRMWGHLERIAAGAGVGIGTRGPGEMQLEIDRRIVRKRISVLKSEIKIVQDRKSRLVEERNREHFTVCIVGYTNAGKSTLFNTLTSAGTLADDKLFATLDTKTRAWRIEKGTEVLLSDTVGFVRDLPHNLVASFRATLEEAVHADLLLHVLDVGHPHAEQQFRTVHEVLDEIGATSSAAPDPVGPAPRRRPSSSFPSSSPGTPGEASGSSDRPRADRGEGRTPLAPPRKPEILLLNKIDTDEGERLYPTWKTLHPHAIPISAKTGRGLAQVAEAVYRAVRGHQVDVTLQADLTNGRLLAFIESHSRVHEREILDTKIQLRATMGKNTLADLTRNDQVDIKLVEPLTD